VSGPPGRHDDDATPAGWLPPTDAPPPRIFPQDEAPAAPLGGDAVALPAADYSARAGAAVIDFFVRLAIILAVSLVGTLATSGDEAATQAISLVGLFVALLYAPIMIVRTGGQTVGHRVVPTLLNYLWPLWDDENEALHDKVCSTRVVAA
jgi:uncharacterized RDD family membrane protein YckC